MYDNRQLPQIMPYQQNTGINPAAMQQQQAYQAQSSLPTLDNNNNRLVTMAMPLLNLITQIKHTIEHPNVAGFRAQVVEEIKSFEHKLMSINYPIRTIIAARYCLCTAIDEAVLGRAWGTQSIWVQESLLSLFHKETWGGERLYIILEDMLADTRKNIDFIELIYFLLSLGFEGKFYGDQQIATREEIRNRLFYRIRNTRQKPEKILSLHWQNQDVRLEKDNSSQLKKLAAITLTLIVLVGTYFNYKVYTTASPTFDRLEEVGNASPITIFNQLINRSQR